MTDVPFSNRELIAMFEEIKTELSEIKTQVKRTNGRVNNLENWRWFITGGLTILALLVLPIVFIVIRKLI